MPGVVRWFRIYCWLLTILALLGSLVSAGMAIWAVVDPASLDADLVDALIVAVVAIFALGASILHAVGGIAWRKPWMRQYGTALLVIGAICGGLLPIIMLVFWLKPEVAAWYRVQQT